MYHTWMCAHQAFPSPWNVSLHDKTLNELCEKPDTLFLTYISSWQPFLWKALCSARGDLKFSVGIGMRQVHTRLSFGRAVRNHPTESWKGALRALVMLRGNSEGKGMSQEEEETSGMEERQFIDPPLQLHGHLPPHPKLCLPQSFPTAFPSPEALPAFSTPK